MWGNVAVPMVGSNVRRAIIVSQGHALFYLESVGLKFAKRRVSPGIGRHASTYEPSLFA